MFGVMRQRGKYRVKGGGDAKVLILIQDPDSVDGQDDCLNKQPRGFNKMSTHLLIKKLIRLLLIHVAS